MNSMQAMPGTSAFALRVLKFLERVEYRHCSSGEDLEAICRLRYKSYNATGLLAPGSPTKLLDGLDEKPNCFNFGVFVEERLVGTVRLHYLCAETPYGPSTTAYPDLIMPRIDAGERFVDPSRLASDPDWAREYSELPYVSTRLVVMASIFFAVPNCLLTIRPNHAGFYKRNFGAERIGEPRDYPDVTCSVDLWQVDIPNLAAKYVPRRPFFKSTKLEQRLLFDRPGSGEVAPLTILPTASATLPEAA